MPVVVVVLSEALPRKHNAWFVWMAVFEVAEILECGMRSYMCIRSMSGVTETHVYKAEMGVFSRPA
jgi:hypothetical protein